MQCNLGFKCKRTIIRSIMDNNKRNILHITEVMAVHRINHNTNNGVVHQIEISTTNKGHHTAMLHAELNSHQFIFSRQRKCHFTGQVQH